MNPYQLPAYYNSLQNIQQLQVSVHQSISPQYLHLILALNQTVGQPVSPLPNPFQAHPPLQTPQMFQQSSQRNIQMPTQETGNRRSQTERVLPKCVKRDECPLLKQFSQDQILAELKHVLEYFSQSEGALPDEELNEQTKVLLILRQVDENLIALIQDRFSNQKKTKEEQIKFILRKCFKFLKSKMNINELTMSAFEIEKLFYKEYFGPNGSVEDLIPFRQESTNKTMNAQYLKKIFSSQKFYNGYLQFLEKFNEIWDQENTEKITNMSKQVLKFIIAGQCERIKSYKRVPWVNQMKKKCHELAISFKSYAFPEQKMDHSPEAPEEQDDQLKKQVKIQENEPCLE